MDERASETVQLVNTLLLDAWRQRASDIHIEPDTRHNICKIRLRVDGTCYEYGQLPLETVRPFISRIKIMANLDIAEHRLPQDGKIVISLNDNEKTAEYRVAIVPTIDEQEDVVLRLLSSARTFTLDQLGLSASNLFTFSVMLNRPHGLILVVGPTGSGKTTTLHSGLRTINTPARKIWTVEDPVEITQTGLRQVQTNSKIGLNFPAALRAFLRADPDVIMVGEMRDRETTHIAIEASLTGHLVLSTLHTGSAAETIIRLLDMGIDPFNFADSLICILAQRLIKTLCQHCRAAYTPDEAELHELAEEFGETFFTVAREQSLMPFQLYKAVGCSKCIQGYSGRTGIHELLTNTTELKKIIKGRPSTDEIQTSIQQRGLLTMKQDGILKVLQGKTDLAQVRKITGQTFPV